MKQRFLIVAGCLALAGSALVIWFKRDTDDLNRAGSEFSALPIAAKRIARPPGEQIDKTGNVVASDASRKSRTSTNETLSELHRHAKAILACINSLNRRRRAERLLAVPTSALNSNERVYYDESLKTTSQELEELGNTGACTGVDESSANRQLYPALLDAAKAGDWDAASCYAVAPVAAPDEQLTPESVAAYRSATRNFVVEGIRRGDWRFVSIAELAVGDNAMRHPGQFKRSLFHGFITPDEKKRYGYVRLERLGATGDYAGQLDNQLRAMESNLSPENVQEMNRWAHEEYRNNFANVVKAEGSPSLCDMR
jgi:hypothetical protein